MTRIQTVSTTTAARARFVPALALTLLALVAAGAGAAPCDAQIPGTRILQGVVRDSDSGETVPNAFVSVQEHRISTLTNFDGRFTLMGLPTGPLTLRVEVLGYAPVDVEIVASDESHIIEIELGRQAIDLEGITVRPARTIDVVRDISQVAISPQVVASLPTMGEIDVFRSLQLLPGIASTGDGSSLYVRGGTPDQNLVLFDGMTMYHVDHFFGLFSAFNADAIKDVTVHTGGFPAKYGGRVSSVVDLTGKTGDEQRFRASAGVNLLSARGVAEVPLGGNGSWLIAARRSYTDILNSPLYNRLFDFRTGDSGPQPALPGGPGRQIIQLQPDFYFYDLNSKLSYRPSQRDLVSFSLYSGADQLDQSASSGFGAGGLGGGAQTQARDHVTDWGNRGASGRWFREWTHRLSSDFMVAGSRYFSDDIKVDAESGRQEDNQVDDLTMRLDLEVRPAPRLTLGLGSWWTESSVSYGFTRTTDDVVSLELDRAATGRLAGAYAQGEWSLAIPLDLTAGLRATHYDLTGEVYMEPRASAAYALTDRLRLKGAWGRFHQFVTRVENEDVLEGSRDFWLLADEDLRPVSSEHRILGASYEGDHFLFNLEGYDKTLNDLTLFSTRYRVDPLTDPGELFFTGDGTARGIEVLAQKLTGPLTGWVGYTLARVTHRFPDVDHGAPFPANHDRAHSVKAVGSYTLGPWKLTSSWVFASGMPYTAPESQYFLTMLDGEVHSYIGVGDKNALRLPAHHRLDVAAFRRFESARFDWELGLSVFNAYNRNNLWYRQVDLSEQPVTITDVGLLGFTPSIDLRITLK